MRALLPLLAASLATLALSLSSTGPFELAAADAPLPPSLGQAEHAAPPPPRVACKRPRTLRLRRFEDGSAWLLCAGRVLVRVSVPG